MMNPTTLLFTAEEVAEKYPAFFARYPISAELTAIPNVFKTFFESSKKNLREFFPFDGEGRVLVAEYTDTENMASVYLNNTLYAIDRVCQLTDMRGMNETAIMSNKMPDGAKFSKYVLGVLKKQSTRMHEHIVTALSRTDLCLELPRLPLSKRTDFEVVLQNFYSELARLKDLTMHMYLSVNPYDIANASNSRFKSCNSIGGAYEPAPICAASSAHMAILRLETSDKDMVGRCYISFSPDMKSFVVQPVYGYMKEELVNDAKDWLRIMIDRQFGTPGKWKLFTGNVSIPMEYLVNDKSATFYVDPSSSCMFREDFTEIPSVRVAGCRCLVCGEVSQKLICYTCTAKHWRKCAACGRLCSKEAAHCAECALLIRTCVRCGYIFYSREPAALVEYCDKCAVTEATCLLCGGSIRFDARYTPEQQNLYTVIGGILYAHTSCVDKGMSHCCTKCGTLKQHFGGCTICDFKSKAMRVAKQAIRLFKDSRKRINTLSSSVAACVENVRIRIPEYTYAMAA